VSFIQSNYSSAKFPIFFPTWYLSSHSEFIVPSNKIRPSEICGVFLKEYKMAVKSLNQAGVWSQYLRVIVAQKAKNNSSGIAWNNPHFHGISNQESLSRTRISNGEGFT
jgi:hypothetical protein